MYVVVNGKAKVFGNKAEWAPVDGTIEAEKITIGENVTFGRGINIKVRGEFAIGDYSHLGDDVHIRGNNVRFGKHLYHSNGLRVGGGGHTNPHAMLIVGNRCTLHDNYINIACPVVLGDDVGLSREVSIQTHGYWLSVLEGYPAKFKGVTVGSGTIVGYRAVILPGVTIAPKIVVGACSVVTRDLDIQRAVYVGNPARFLREIKELSPKKKEELLQTIVFKYLKVANHHGYASDGYSPVIAIKYPFISFGDCDFNVETLTFEGTEDEQTDHFRDYIRKWGLRFYSTRPFRTVTGSTRGQI